MAVLSAPSVVLAADSVQFTLKNSFKSLSTLRSLEAFTFSAIAEVDLNDDGLKEFILRDDTVMDRPEFRILGMNDGKFFELGTVHAQKLMLSYNRNHGVRSILAFENARNDYEYIIYQWDANRSHYVDQKHVLREDKI